MFGDTVCPCCSATRERLASKRLDFIEIHVGKFANEENLRFCSLTRQHEVPVLIIGNKLITGYRPSEIEAAFRELEVKT